MTYLGNPAGAPDAPHDEAPRRTHRPATDADLDRLTAEVLRRLAYLDDDRAAWQRAEREGR